MKFPSPQCVHCPEVSSPEVQRSSGLRWPLLYPQALATSLRLIFTKTSDHRLGDRFLNRLIRRQWIKSRCNGSRDGFCHCVMDKFLLGNETNASQPGFVIDFESC